MLEAYRKPESVQMPRRKLFILGAATMVNTLVSGCNEDSGSARSNYIPEPNFVDRISVSLEKLAEQAEVRVRRLQTQPEGTYYKK